jgi:hypothetical protein
MHIVHAVTAGVQGATHGAFVALTDIVNLAVLVIINAVACDFTGINPYVVSQIRVGDLNATICTAQHKTARHSTAQHNTDLFVV